MFTGTYGTNVATSFNATGGTSASLSSEWVSMVSSGATSHSFHVGTVNIGGTSTVVNKDLALTQTFAAGYRYNIKVSFKPSSIDIDDAVIYGGGNCWVIPMNASKDEKYSFTATEGRTTDKPGTTVGKTVFGAKVVWMDVQGLITEEPTYDSNSHKMTFKIARGKIGNAVIAATASDGTICWSWHVWVVNDNSFMINPRNGFMDRNLGAMSNNSSEKLASYGLYYQWGRKDPFPGANGISSTIPNTLYLVNGRTTSIQKMNAAVPLASAIKAPLSFFGSAAYPYDWITPQDANLWNSELDRFNPAPKGWTIPESNMWTGVSIYNGGTFSNGYTWAAYGGWYPCSGYMLYYSGALYMVGSDGSCWSRTTYSVQSHKLYFLYGAAYAQYPYGRADGFSVRCVHE